MTPAAKASRKGIGGRPRKFTEASHPVTVTLPESALRQLNQINPDRALAIAKAAAVVTLANHPREDLVEIAEVAKKTGLIIIGPSQALRRITFLHLVEVAPARFLLALDRGLDNSRLELALADLLEDLPEEDNAERNLLEQLLELISRIRRTKTVTMAEILFVHLDGK
jgi:hypothetical protein